MKIHLFGILALMLVLSGGCHKAVSPEVKPKAIKIDTTPFAGTWILESLEMNPISENLLPPDFQDGFGKDSSWIRYDGFFQNHDSLIIKPNSLFYLYSPSRNSYSRWTSVIHYENSILSFSDCYWFITNFTANELDLKSPRYCTQGVCNENDMTKELIVKFQRVK